MGTAVGIPLAAQATMKKLYGEALFMTGIPSSKASIYEDEMIKVTMLAETRAHQGRVTLLIYNKTGADILNIKLSFATLPHLAIRVQDPSATRLVPGEETKALVALDCMRPFTESPIFDLSFNIGQAPYKYPITLPIHVNSFFEALPTDRDTYMNRWKSITGEGLEAQEIFYSAKPVTPQLVAYIRATIFQGLHLGVAAGLDNDNTATGSASFRTGTAGPDGNMIAVGVMLRLEGDAANGRFRVTIRGKHVMIVQALKTVIKAILEKV
jgi:hypothetical protein